jgi:hypothetical protein
MDKFLKIKSGMSLEECQQLLGRPLRVVPIREENFKSDEVSFPEGVRLFFNINTGKLETIRFDAPFALPVGGVYIGNTKAEVKDIRGKADRIDPFPFPKALPTTIWIYEKTGDWVRYDFEKKRNGKCVTIYL